MHTFRVVVFTVLCIAGVAVGQIAPDTQSTSPATSIARKQVRIDVREAPYSATGDGVADDTAAFTGAISAINTAGGGTLYIPRGTYLLSSATLAVASNHALSITADNVTIKGDGDGQTKIQLTGTGECGFLLGRSIDNFCVQDLTFQGNSCHAAGSLNITGSFVWWDNTRATADHHGFQVERCQVENCKANAWIYALCYEGHDMSDVKIRDNRFLSSPGNMVSTETGVSSTAVRLGTPRGKPNWLRDYEVSSNYCEGRYIRSFFDAHDQVQYGSVHDNEVRDVGVDLATKERQCYAISFYGNHASYASVYANRILHPYSCGVYAVTSSYLNFADNYIVGQVDDADSTLLKGGYAIANCNNVTIKGGQVEDSVIGIQVQPVNYNSQVTIDGIEIRNCSNARAFSIRPNATWKHCGGVTITNCHVENTDLVIGRGSTLSVGNVTLSNNIFRHGHIRWTKQANDCLISNNRIYATGAGPYALHIEGGDGLQIVNNQLWGPGSSVAESCGIYLGAVVMNPSVITGNTVSGFKYGLRGQYSACTFRDNVFFDVEDVIEDVAAGDLGRDAPGTIANTVATYWTKGQFVQNMYPTTAGNAQGWLCVGPASGLGCSYAATTFTGDMKNADSVITNVSDISRFIPGVPLTLANAAAGPATLTTQVVSWQITYNTLTGAFARGEEVEGRTSLGLANINADNGTDTMQVVHVRQRAGTFQIGETIAGHHSGATAVITTVALKVADPCGNTVNGVTLRLVTPTWVTVPMRTADSEITGHAGAPIRNDAASAG